MGTSTFLLESGFKIMSSNDSKSVEKTMPRINIINAASYGAPEVTEILAARIDS